MKAEALLRRGAWCRFPVCRKPQRREQLCGAVRSWYEAKKIWQESVTVDEQEPVQNHQCFGPM